MTNQHELPKISRLGGYLDMNIRRRGWDAAEFARRSGIPKSTVSRIINGQSSPELETYIKIARGLDVPVIEVLTVAGYDLEGTINGERLIHLARLTQALPWLEVALAKIAQLNQGDLEEVLRYIEFQEAKRSRQ